MNLNLLEMEFHLSAYQCYRLRQYRTTHKLIEEICESPQQNVPECPPAKLFMRVHKGIFTKEAKNENIIKSEDNVLTIGQGNKVKLPNLQLIQVKGSGVTQVSSGGQVGNAQEKITMPAGFAQLVQTSTGKHILFTPSSGISTSNISGTTGNICNFVIIVFVLLSIGK